MDLYVQLNIVHKQRAQTNCVAKGEKWGIHPWAQALGTQLGTLQKLKSSF